MIEEVKIQLKDSMDKALLSLQKQFLRVRTGRANASILDPVQVDYYGTPTPIKQVGQISTPEARLLQIQPFDKTLISEIEKAIINSNLGLNPGNDGNLIRIQFPALTEDTRKDLIKQIKKISEDTKITVRNSRRDQNEVIKKAQKNKEITEDDVKRYLDEVQKITDKYISEVDEIAAAKEKDLMTV